MPDGAAAARKSDAVGWLRRNWPLLIGLAALIVPTVVSLGGTVWNQESGAHGPIIIFTGAWLISRQWGATLERRKPGSTWVAVALIAVCLAVYAFSRAFDFISTEVAGLYGVILATLYMYLGHRALLQNWFPFAYFAFVVPPPGWLLDQITGPLKQFVSFVATGALSIVGVPVSREGVTIYVAQYQLLVEDACSGMNSLIGLIAISLFYIYLLRSSSFRYAALLTAFVVPIAVAGNIMRIMVLILLTYFFGDEVAQGFLHQLSGIFLFAVDLLLVFALDTLLARTVPRWWKAQ